MAPRSSLLSKIIQQLLYKQGSKEHQWEVRQKCIHRKCKRQIISHQTNFNSAQSAHNTYLLVVSHTIRQRRVNHLKLQHDVKKKPDLPISLFRSLVVQLWKNSVIRPSRARSDASSEAWRRMEKTSKQVRALSSTNHWSFTITSITLQSTCFAKQLLMNTNSTVINVMKIKVLSYLFIKCLVVFDMYASGLPVDMFSPAHVPMFYQPQKYSSRKWLADTCQRDMDEEHDVPSTPNHMYGNVSFNQWTSQRVTDVSWTPMRRIEI